MYQCTLSIIDGELFQPLGYFESHKNVLLSSSEYFLHKSESQSKWVLVIVSISDVDIVEIEFVDGTKQTRALRPHQSESKVSYLICETEVCPKSFVCPNGASQTVTLISS
jgi:hypothetical protein